MFKRGFKSWCERVASEKRRELGLRSYDPLDPKQLAQHLGIPVLNPQEIPGLSQKCLRQLLQNDRDGWSAVTLHSGTKTVIVLNSAHSAARQSSDLMHELAHFLLAHTPSRIDVTKDLHLLLRTHDRMQEDEASWLAGCLLLPRTVLVLIQRRGESAQSAAQRYGVSVDMVNYRRNVTGVMAQARRFKVRTPVRGQKSK